VLLLSSLLFRGLASTHLTSGFLAESYYQFRTPSACTQFLASLGHRLVAVGIIGEDLKMLKYPCVHFSLVFFHVFTPFKIPLSTFSLITAYIFIITIIIIIIIIMK
jgi:hypothetical protein